jgi:hypothetical protein
MPAMDSLQWTEYQFRVQECLTVCNKAHVGRNVIITHCLGIETGHSGSTVADEDAIPMVVVLANSGE